MAYLKAFLYAAAATAVALVAFIVLVSAFIFVAGASV